MAACVPRASTARIRRGGRNPCRPVGAGSGIWSEPMNATKTIITIIIIALIAAGGA